MFNSSEKTCPSCEYNRGNSGKAVMRGDKIVCLECGNSWKEYGSATTASRTTPTNRHMQSRGGSTHAEIARDLAKDLSADSAGNSYPAAAMAKIMPMMAATTGLMLFIVFLSWVGLNSFSDNTKLASLYTDTVSFEEIDRPSGGKVVKVRGRIANQHDERKIVHRVEIILRGQGGREISRWQHASKMTALQPGDAMQFVSAFPVSEAKIHSVEARAL